VFPRFYCYSADYPEKYDPTGGVTQLFMLPTRVLIANIKNLGRCPCPPCLVELGGVRDLGRAVDRQRHTDTRKPTQKLFRIIKKAREVIFKGFKV